MKNFYSVPATNLPELLGRIDKLNKRCRRLGIPEIGYTTELDYVAHVYRVATSGSKAYIPEVDLEEYEARRAATVAAGCVAPKPTGEVLEWYEVAITGTAPKYDGWKFIATLEPLEGADEPLNLIMAVPGETCPGDYIKRVGVCDHCNQHRNRKQTFVVRHDSGETKAVGRQCIRDFLGHDDPNKLAAWAELLAELGTVAGAAEDEGWLGGGGHVAPRYDIEYYLGWVAGVVRVKGWCSRGKASEYGKIATVDVVNSLLCPPKFSGRDGARARREWEELVAAAQPTEADKAEAEAALEWTRELDIEALMADEKNNYLLNVATLSRAGVINSKTCGLGGSIIAAHKRHLEQTIKREEWERRGPSVHVGELKKRQEFTVTVDRIIPTESEWGCTNIHRMRDAAGNDLVWFASGDGLEAGGAYLVKATPQKHGDYNGRPQTVVNRVKVVEELTPAAE